MMGVRVGARGELHAVPAMAWIASFTLCTLGDVMLGRWVLLPLFVAGFYGGTFIIALVTYPALSFHELASITLSPMLEAERL